MNHLEMAKDYMDVDPGKITQLRIEAGRTHALISIAESLEKIAMTPSERSEKAMSEINLFPDKEDK